ncbi:MAG: S8 family serine peptidase, partial [Chitinispirillaceae bacterium]|nr:S8 family serine peptidase [Chitinispirillaceae bacterium]
MSIGLATGPHDGTSLIDRTIDSLSGPGRIIVGAVGNDGGRYSHISFSLAPGATGKTWAMPMVDSSSSPASSFLGADFWGESGKTFTGSFLVMDRRTLVYQESIDTFTTSRTRVYAIDTIPWTGTSGTVDTFYMQYAVEKAAESNNKPHMMVVAYTTNPHLQLGISITNPPGGTGQLIHGWNSRKESFHHFDLDGFTKGDSTYTVNEIGGTAKRNITVGAFCGRTEIPQWNDTVHLHDNATLGDIFISSGVGPTVDGRIKPDITAPGWSIIAALSRTAPKTWEEVAVWPDTGSTLSRYGGMTGTSMASPVVAGIVALLLQAKPDLTPEEVKAVLQKTAKTDEYTGSLTTFSNKWGAGKADALAALGEILGLPVHVGDQTVPGKHRFTIRYQHRRLFVSGGPDGVYAKRIICSDLLGRTIFERQLSRNTSTGIDVTLTAGMYLFRISPFGGKGKAYSFFLLIP